MQKGITSEIKEHLEQGRSSGELIAMGYKSATVYKAQRAWRSEQQRQASESLDDLIHEAPVEESAPSASEESEDEIEEDSEALMTELEMLRLQIERYEATIKELEERVRESEGFKKQVAALKLEARELSHLRQRIRLLEANRHFSQNARANLQHQLNSAEAQLEEQSRQRAELEEQIAGARTQVADRAYHNRQLEEQLKLCQGLIENLAAELECLRPLQVWVGHPCVVCRKPTSGVVSRDMAERLLQDFGHPACLHKQNSNLGKWLAGGVAAVYGISKLR